ncbi:MAG: 30S ribosomal protein S15 [Planctomycetota bacterium]
MISTAAKKKAITSAKRHDNDSGSPEVQVSVLTERITSLQDHFRANPKDHGSRRGLLLMVGQRNRLLRYLSTVDRERYNALIQKLGMRK